MCLSKDFAELLLLHFTVERRTTMRKSLWIVAFAFFGLGAVAGRASSRPG